MRKIKASAPTRSEAIQNALDELGCEMHEVDIKILDVGSKGFLGIGSRDVEVLVRAEHLPDDGSYADVADDDNIGNRLIDEDFGGKDPANRKARPVQNDRNRNRNRNQNRNRNRQNNQGNNEVNGNRIVDDNIGNRIATEGDNRSGNNRNKNRNRNRNKNRNRDDQQSNKNSNNNGERKERKGQNERNDSRNDNKRAGNNNRKRDEKRQNKSAQKAKPRPKRRERTVPIDPVAAAELGKETAVFLQEVITNMGMESTVTSKVNDELDIVLEVATEDSAILIGRKGRNLQALQFIVNRIQLKGEENDVVDRIVVDVEGYIQRRRESLEEMALSMAARAKETGRSFRIKPLDAHERRIVHLVLENDDEVRTFSLGGSTLRRVVIIPNNEGQLEASDESDDDNAEGESPDVDTLEAVEEESVEADADTEHGSDNDSTEEDEDSKA
jgi:predicted RNA-binding protein Jag